MLLNSARLVTLLGMRAWLPTVKSTAGFSSASSALARLRRLTGHPLGFCREALVACQEDYNAAVKWLDDEALKRGMLKADKLKSRILSQGLIGLIVTPRCVAACEVNCETDFVARNKEFQSLVASATESLHAYFLNANESETHRMNHASLGNLPLISSSSNCKSLSDLLSFTIGSVGENMAVTRAVGMNLMENQENCSQLAAYCHISSAGMHASVRGVRFGKYVSLLRYRPTMATQTTGIKEWEERASKVAVKLCQHIVGMNPQPRLLELSAVPAKNPDDERCLLRQAFLLDESLSVDALLKRHDMGLEDFVRLELCLDEEAETETSTPETSAET